MTRAVAETEIANHDADALAMEVERLRSQLAQAGGPCDTCAHHWPIGSGDDNRWDHCRRLGVTCRTAGWRCGAWKAR